MRYWGPFAAVPHWVFALIAVVLAGSMNMVAAGAAQDAKKSLPRAINSVMWRRCRSNAVRAGHSLFHPDQASRG
jgi:L-asparagine transporter-like permease